MRAAIITEEQIKAIEEEVKFWCIPLRSTKLLKALDILQSLKVQEPVAWTHPDFDIAVLRKPQPFQMEGWAPLFSVGQP